MIRTSATATASVTDDQRDDADYGTPDGKDDAAFLVEMRERRQLCQDAFGSQYKRAIEHMRFAFVPGNQWDAWMQNSRTGRPQYEINKTRQALKQITNDQRQNRPKAKVRAARDATTEQAEQRQAMLRGIEASSRADDAYDNAFLFAVGGGYGCWRIRTDYADEGSFEQDIIIDEVANPFAVWFDPTAKKKDKRDGRFLFLEDDIPRQQFKARYPMADMVAFESPAPDAVGWWNHETIRVVEYWYKQAEEREILQLSDGRTVNAKDVSAILDELEEAGITVAKRRTVTVDVVKQCICSGAEILEGPNDWPGKFIPFIPVWGNIVNIEGKDEFCGETAFVEGPQRMHNYERSTFIEILGKQPLSPFIADAESIQGYEDQWSRVNTDAPPVLLYNHRPDLPDGGKPARLAPPTFPAALAQAGQMSADDIKAASGKYDASLGARSNETSGKAILARQREGDVSSFDYIDNLGKSMLFSYEVIDDLLPHIYDTPRTMRLIGEDDQEKVAQINQPVLDHQTGQWVEVNELAQGKFALSVTIGPSFTTQRMETAEAMLQLSNDPSPLGLLAKYGFIKSMDAPGMEDVRKGARTVLVGMKLLEPEEGEQPAAPPPPPPPPNPKDVADAQLKLAQTDKTVAETQQIRAELPAKVMAARADADRAVVDSFNSVPGPFAPGQVPPAPVAPMPEPGPMPGPPLV